MPSHDRVPNFNLNLGSPGRVSLDIGPGKEWTLQAILSMKSKTVEAYGISVQRRDRVNTAKSDNSDE